MKVLNLFAYTGIASLVAAKAGAEVTHIDASKKAIGWARENQTLAGLGDAADPLDLRRRGEIRRARGSGAATATTGSSSTRRNSAAGRRARSGTSSPTSRACSRACVGAALGDAAVSDPHRLLDPRLLPVDPRARRRVPGRPRRPPRVGRAGAAARRAAGGSCRRRCSAVVARWLSGEPCRRRGG